jgi:hypothetical protein
LESIVRIEPESSFVRKKPTDALASTNGTGRTLPWRTIDELVAQPLVVSFAMIMRHEVSERLPKMAFTEWNHAIDIFRCGGAVNAASALKSRPTVRFARA